MTAFALWIWITSFNPRPHTAGDIVFFLIIRWKHCFNPRPHTAGDEILIDY